MTKIHITILAIFFTSMVLGQTPISRNKIFSCEEVAIANDSKNSLIAGKVYEIKLDCSPKGAGNKKEVEIGSDSKYYFEKEHNIVWVQFTAVRKSMLAIKIKPDSEKDDYDFLLFKDEGEGTLKKIASKQLKPIRSNIARTKNVNGGITGLKYETENLFINSGVNECFSKYIEVTENEVYYLVLDNVYDGGKGATITLDYFTTKTIEGIVENEQQKPIKAEVLWENIATNDELVKTTSDPLTGAFKMTVPYNTNSNNMYVLSAYTEGHIFNEVSYTAMEIATFKPVPIKMMLPELKKGEKMVLNNINFEGNKAIFLESAYPSLKRLGRLMKKNPSLNILIEGHTNGCSGGVESTQILSENRAKVSKEHLVKMGISANRISTIGLNCKHMLYPQTSSEKFQSLNRRIEVLVKEF